jgi:hypothetical protein
VDRLVGECEGLLAQAQADNNIRGAILALKELRECLELKLRSKDRSHDGTGQALLWG